MKDDGTLSSKFGTFRTLEKHYEEKVIVLIDEYDVPLAKQMKMAITMRWYF